MKDLIGSIGCCKTGWIMLSSKSNWSSNIRMVSQMFSTLQWHYDITVKACLGTELLLTLYINTNVVEHVELALQARIKHSPGLQSIFNAESLLTVVYTFGHGSRNVNAPASYRTYILHFSKCNVCLFVREVNFYRVKRVVMYRKRP